MKVELERLRALGWSWPPHERVADTQGAVDLAAVTAALEADLALHRRDRDEMYAFAARWNAPVDDVTDRRDEVAAAIASCEAALEALREIAAAFSQDPPRRRPEPAPVAWPEPTSEEAAAAEERARLPTRAELRVLLETYFECSEPILERVERALRAADPRQLREGLHQAVQGLFPLERYRGQLWVERAWGGRSDDAGRTLALHLIAGLPDAPRAKYDLPAELVGTWRQLEPYTGTWVFGADGTLHTTIDPTSNFEAKYIPAHDAWCVHRAHEPRPMVALEALATRGQPHARRHRLHLEAVSAKRLELSHNGLEGPVAYRFER